jgi:hypothetical protein
MNASSENELCLLIGETMVVTSQFDDAISECVATCLDPQWMDLVYPMVRKLDQQARIHVLGKMSERLYTVDDPANVEFRGWLNRMAKIRRRRSYRARRVARRPTDPLDRGAMEQEIALMRDACAEAAIWRIRLMERGLAMRTVQPCF